MGTYRFILSSLVVLFHFGTLSTPSGYSAVLGFYLLSGYLMPLSIDRNYGVDVRGIIRFYGNRILRIFPLYFIILLLTVMAISWYGAVSFSYGGKELKFFPDITGYAYIDVFHELFMNLFVAIPTPVELNALLLNGFPKVVTQAWSLVVEFMFYALAPILLLLFKMKNFYGRVLYFSIFSASLLFALYTNYNGLDFQTYRYRSVFGVFFIFMLGFTAYLYRDYIPRVPRAKFVVFILISVYVLYVIFVNRRSLIESQIYIALFIQFLITVIGVSVSYRREYGHLDKMLGDLSFGVFVGHRFVAYVLMMLTSDESYIESFRGVFGVPGSLVFGFWCLFFTVILAFLAHQYIERFINMIRDKVRGHVPYIKPV